LNAALPYAEMPTFIQELRAQEGIAARALEFTALTAARTGDTIGAIWDEANESDHSLAQRPNRCFVVQPIRVRDGTVIAERGLAIYQQIAVAVPADIAKPRAVAVGNPARIYAMKEHEPWAMQLRR
jgi:hypothetical protein